MARGEKAILAAARKITTAVDALIATGFRAEPSVEGIAEEKARTVGEQSPRIFPGRLSSVRVAFRQFA